jgi:hypothetical protein
MTGLSRCGGTRWWACLALLTVGLLVACAPSGLPEATDTTVPPLLATAPPSPLETPQVTASAPSPLLTLPAEQPPYPEPPGQPGGRVAEFPNPILVYRHEGRSPQQWTIYPTGLIVADDGGQRQVPPEEVAPLFDYFTSAAFWELDTLYVPTPERPGESLRRVIVYYRGEIREVALPEESGAAEEPLQPLLERLEQLTALFADPGRVEQ